MFYWGSWERFLRAQSMVSLVLGFSIQCYRVLLRVQRLFLFSLQRFEASAGIASFFGGSLRLSGFGNVHLRKLLCSRVHGFVTEPW